MGEDDDFGMETEREEYKMIDIPAGTKIWPVQIPVNVVEMIKWVGVKAGLNNFPDKMLAARVFAEQPTHTTITYTAGDADILSLLGYKKFSAFEALNAGAPEKYMYRLVRFPQPIDRGESVIHLGFIVNLASL